MFNVTVIDGKRILKCIITVVIIILLIIILKQNKDNTKEVVTQSVMQKVYSNSYLTCMDTTISSMRYINNSNNIEEKQNNSFVNSILGTELNVNNRIVAKTVDDVVEKTENEEMNIDDKEEIIDTPNPTDIVTQVIDENNIKATYTNTYENVEIKNKTSYELTKDLLVPDVDLENKKDIIIFHTHTSESYTSSEKFNYQMTRKL